MWKSIDGFYSYLYNTIRLAHGISESTIIDDVLRTLNFLTCVLFIFTRN